MDWKQIKELMREFDESGLSRMRISQDSFEMEFEKQTASLPPVVPAPSVAPAAELSAPVSQESAVETGEQLLSPMVGTFYRSPSPDSAPFVSVGDTVKKGQPIAILEAMKIMNELEAEFDCKILELLVEDGQAVEYDMPIYRVEKL